MGQKIKLRIRSIYLMLAVILFLSNSCRVLAEVRKDEARIEPGIYIFVSFAMNDESLHSYFIEAQKYRATLVMRGLVGASDTRNRFMTTKAKVEEAQINVDINPNLFEQLNITRVPVIAHVDDKGNVKKISGHIHLKTALEKMNIKVEQ